MNTIPILSEIIADYPEFSGIHPIADCFPMKPDAEFWELVENIRKDGVVDPLLREKGTNLLIDGRNRLLALSITNSLFRFADVEPGFIIATVVAKNIHGKQHDASQRAMIAQNLLPFYQDAAKARQTIGTNQHTKSLPQKVAEGKNSEARDAAGKAAGVNHTYVDKASDPEALADFREAVKGEPGRPKAEKETPNNVRVLQVTCGNGKAYTLSRLKRETPELFAAVVRVLQATGRTAPITERQARTAAEAIAAAPKLATHGRPTKGNENKGDFITLKARGTSKEFLAARINRDHPEIAERVKAGDPQRRSTPSPAVIGQADASDALAGNVAQWRWH